MWSNCRTPQFNNTICQEQYDPVTLFIKLAQDTDNAHTAQIIISRDRGDLQDLLIFKFSPC